MYSTQPPTTPERRQVFGAVFFAAIGVLLLVLIVSILQTRELVGAVREQQRRIVHTVDLIEDCTSVRGECYKQGQAQRAETVRAIGDDRLRVISAALACQADGITELERLARCTIRLSRAVD